MNKNDTIEISEKLYYEMNPNTKMDVPSFAYETTENWKKEWLNSQSKLTLYDWIKENKKIK